MCSGYRQYFEPPHGWLWPQGSRSILNMSPFNSAASSVQMKWCHVILVQQYSTSKSFKCILSVAYCIPTNNVYVDLISRSTHHQPCLDSIESLGSTGSTVVLRLAPLFSYSTSSLLISQTTLMSNTSSSSWSPSILPAPSRANQPRLKTKLSWPGIRFPERLRTDDTRLPQPNGTLCQTFMWGGHQVSSQYQKSIASINQFSTAYHEPHANSSRLPASKAHITFCIATSSSSLWDMPWCFKAKCPGGIQIQY